MERLPAAAFIGIAVVLGVIALSLLLFFRPGSRTITTTNTITTDPLTPQQEGVMRGTETYNLPGAPYYGTVTPPARQNPQPTPSPEPEPVACTMDALICPDGSAVGRMPPSCQFAPCPGQ